MADERNLRLIFEYDGDRVNLVFHQPVDMVAPPSEPLDDIGNRIGSWVEVRDTQGNALHRQVVHDPLRASAEVFSPDPDTSLRRVETANPKGAFTVVVPDLSEADQVAIVTDMGARRETTAEGEALGPVRRVLRFALHDDSSDAGGQS